MSPPEVQIFQCESSTSAFEEIIGEEVGQLLSAVTASLLELIWFAVADTNRDRVEAILIG